MNKWLVLLGLCCFCITAVFCDKNPEIYKNELNETIVSVADYDEAFVLFSKIYRNITPEEYRKPWMLNFVFSKLDNIVYFSECDPYDWKCEHRKQEYKKKKNYKFYDDKNVTCSDFLDLNKDGNISLLECKTACVVKAYPARYDGFMCKNLFDKERYDLDGNEILDKFEIKRALKTCQFMVNYLLNESVDALCTRGYYNGLNCNTGLSMEYIIDLIPFNYTVIQL